MDMEGLHRATGLIIVKCLNAHKKSVGKKVFNDLTSDTILPSIDQTAAFDLLELEASIVGPADGDGLSSLQQRCVDGIARCWKHCKSSRAAREVLENLLHSKDWSPSLVKEIMIRSFKIVCGI